MSDIPGTAWAKKMNSVETFESENADELAEKMMDFINKNKINKKDLEQSREHILENYTTDIWGDKIISYYNELLK